MKVWYTHISGLVSFFLVNELYHNWFSNDLLSQFSPLALRPCSQINKSKQRNIFYFCTRNKYFTRIKKERNLVYFSIFMWDIHSYKFLTKLLACYVVYEQIHKSKTAGILKRNPCNKTLQFIFKDMLGEAWP